MNAFMKDDRTGRLSKPEMAALIARLPVLRKIIKKKRSRPEEEDDTQHEEHVEGMAFMSRYNKDLVYTPYDESQNNKLEGDADAKMGYGKDDKNEDSKIINSRDRREKQRLAMSLATISTRSSVLRLTIVEEDAIKILIYMSSLPDSIILRSCASALASLSVEYQIRKRMIDEGVVAAILTLSNHLSRAIIIDCTLTLVNLTAESGYESRIVKEGATVLVLRAVNAFPETLDICLKILLNLSCVSEKYERLEDIIETLANFNLNTMSTENECLLMSAFVNLSAIKNVQLRLVEDGVMRYVEGALRSESRRLRKLGSEVMYNLTSESKARIKLVDAGIIKLLKNMSNDEYEDVRTSCVKAFYNLAIDESCRERIVAGKAVSAIIKMSMEKFENVVMGRMASRILRILCGDPNIAYKLVSDGIIKALMSLLRTAKDDAIIQQYCAESICSLFQIGDSMERLVSQGAVGILVSLSQSNVNMVTGEWCAFALYHLATNKSCPISMLESGILPCLIKLCEYSSDRTKEFCAATLEYVTRIESVDSSGAIPILVHMLRSVTDESTTKANCAASLYNLAGDDQSCHMMLEAGALHPVVRLTQSQHMQTKMKCAAMLSRLSLHQDFYSQFTTGDVLRVLLELSSVDHLFTQRKVIIALSNLSQSKELRAQLLSLDPMPYIIKLASKCDENLRRGCASILCNLSYVTGSEKVISKSGVTEMLIFIARVSSDEIATKIICVKAIVNLMAEPSLYHKMIKMGVVWALGTLALVENEELSTLCLRALCRLSSTHAREIVNAKGSAAMKSVLHAVSQPENLEILRIASRTLTNMLLKTNDGDEGFRLSAVQSMSLLVECHDEEVSELCIISLCLASQSESCREAIVKSGLLGKIDATTIFTKPRVSYAYLTMFGNLANNAEMRTELLDERSISRFHQICQSKDLQLTMAVVKAIYCVSCAPENIATLVDQNMLTIVENILLAHERLEHDLIVHLIGLVYNLTTNEDVQAKLVSQGIVPMILKIWRQSIMVSEHVDVGLQKLAVLSMCQLACGRVNTSRMVVDGCTELLIYPVMYRDKNEQTHGITYYTFDMALHHRVSISFRNLLCVVANQNRMIDDNVLDALMRMSLDASEYIKDLEASIEHDNPSTSTFGKRQKSQKRLTNSEEENGVAYAIIRNCSAALRSLTYNIDLRKRIASGGAIDIILNSFSSNMILRRDLLRELETESWSNGCRGTIKDGRAAYLAPFPLHTDLLKGAHGVQLNVEACMVDLEKYYVHVEVEDSQVDIEASTVAIELSIDKLETFKAGDENVIAPVLMSCSKLISEIEEDTSYTLEKVMDEEGFDSEVFAAIDGLNSPAEDSGTEKGSPERGSPERGSPERGNPERGSPERGSPGLLGSEDSPMDMGKKTTGVDMLMVRNSLPEVNPQKDRNSSPRHQRNASPRHNRRRSSLGDTHPGISRRRSSSGGETPSLKLADSPTKLPDVIKHPSSLFEDTDAGFGGTQGLHHSLSTSRGSSKSITRRVKLINGRNSSGVPIQNMHDYRKSRELGAVRNGDKKIRKLLDSIQISRESGGEKIGQVMDTWKKISRF